VQVERVPRTATVDELAVRIRESGYVTIDELVAVATMDRIEAELEPYLAASPYGDNDGIGKLTRRTGSLIARSSTVRELALNELVLGDELLYDGYPFDQGYEVYVNTLWR
jgi:hypothetical protein